MPEAYDQEGVVNQEKRFSVAVQRYRSGYTGKKGCIDVYNHHISHSHTHRVHSHIFLGSSIHNSWHMNQFSGNASCSVLLRFLFYFILFVPSRDIGAGDKMNPFAEQEAWEEHQIGELKL